jgi:hypothetical protein
MINIIMRTVEFFPKKQHQGKTIVHDNVIMVF